MGHFPINGVLHGILANLKPQEAIEFGIGSSVLKQLVYGDHNQFNVEEVREFLASQGRDVNR